VKGRKGRAGKSLSAKLPWGAKDRKGLEGRMADSAVGGMRMWIVKRALPVAVALAVVSVVTLILWYFKFATFGSDHPVFFYLIPLALVTMLYGRLPALLGVVTATACADFFLYDPLYSFNISSRIEFGDLACFALLAFLGVKCTSELFRPITKIPPPKSRYGSL
jgi:K+-sensing histidine kinase KdpD